MEAGKNNLAPRAALAPETDKFAPKYHVDSVSTSLRAAF